MHPGAQKKSQQTYLGPVLPHSLSTSQVCCRLQYTTALHKCYSVRRLQCTQRLMPPGFSPHNCGHTLPRMANAFVNEHQLCPITPWYTDASKRHTMRLGMQEAHGSQGGKRSGRLLHSTAGSPAQSQQPTVVVDGDIQPQHFSF